MASSPELEDNHIHAMFDEIKHQIALEHHYPELHDAQLDIAENGHDKKRDEVFPMQQQDSRRIKFNFSKARFGHFSSQFSTWLEDQPIHNRDLQRVSLFMFIGVEAVRPVVEFDHTRYIHDGGKRHADVIRRFYKDSKDVSNTFKDIFGNSPEGDHVVAGDISDNDIERINGQRVAMSYLYRAYSRDQDKKALLSETLRDSRASIREFITNQRPHYRLLGESTLGASEGHRVGNFVTVTNLPSWLISLSCPVTESSYKHIGAELWDDDFYIQTAESTVDYQVLDEELVAEGFVVDDLSVGSGMMPSSYSPQK